MLTDFANPWILAAGLTGLATAAFTAVALRGQQAWRQTRKQARRAMSGEASATHGGDAPVPRRKAQ